MQSSLPPNSRERGRPGGYFPKDRGIEERMQVLISAARAHPTNNFTLLPLHRNWREALPPRGDRAPAAYS